MPRTPVPATTGQVLTIVTPTESTDGEILTAYAIETKTRTKLTLGTANGKTAGLSINITCDLSLLSEPDTYRLEVTTNTGKVVIPNSRNKFEPEILEPHSLWSND